MSTIPSKRGLVYFRRRGLNMATPPFKFNERSDQAFYHDVRIFIMGYDVTPWLMGSVSTSFSGLGGMNQASFTLSNHNYAFEMTLDNLNGKFRTFDAWTPQGMSSEAAKKWIYDLKNGFDPKTGKNVPRNFKHKVKSWGPKKSTKEVVGKLNPVSENDDQSFTATTDRFPFVLGSTVFHKTDQLRIFVKNPFTRFYNQWYVAFSGYLTSHILTRDYVNGQSVVRIQAQDIRSLMQKMRVQVNPSAQVSNENVLVVGSADPKAGIDSTDANAGYFNDMISNHTTISHVLGGKNFEQTVNFLMLGKGQAGGDDVTIEGSAPVMLNAVAKFQAGVTLEYDVSKTQERKKVLERFTNIVNFGQDPDILNVASRTRNGNDKLFQRSKTELFLDWEDMYKTGKGSHPWGDYSVDAGRVHFLLPAKGHPASNLVSASNTGASTSDKISWASRLELLYETCNNIDYQIYVSGWGDMIFEFPMYDFNPDDFGPAYEKLYTFNHHTVSDTVDDEGGEEVSGLIIQSNLLAPQLRTGQEQAKAGQPALNLNLYTTIFSNILASRIGVQMKTITKLGIIDQEDLAQFGFLEFNKIIAEYSKYSFVSTFRPYLNVNRPIHSALRDRIGMLDTFTTTWNIRKEVSSELNLRYVRRREHLRDSEGKLDLTQVVYRSIVGGEATPISYNKIYTDKSLEGIGVAQTTSNSKKNQGTQDGD